MPIVDPQDLLRERDELRERNQELADLANNEQLHAAALAEQWGDMKAEVERLKQQVRSQPSLKAQQEYVQRLEAEVERLKALLREHGIEDVQSLPRTEAPR